MQSDIFETFGTRSPSAPILRCRNATQTSVVLEWDPIELAAAELRSLSLYRNGTKAGVIPRDKLSTKISGLALDTEYTFHLVLRTSAGQYTSEKLTVKTHKMTDLSGITVTPGVMPGQLRDSLAVTINRIGAKMIDTVRIDTTHFVCIEPRGQAWERAVEMNVPVVVPDWIKGCEREGRVVGVRSYYLDADPAKRQIGPAASPQQQQQQRSSAASGQNREGPRIEHTPPTPERSTQHEEPSSASEPPTPPPKFTHEPAAERSSQEEDESVDDTTVVTRTVDDEDEDSEDTEKATDEDLPKKHSSEEKSDSDRDSSEQEPKSATEEEGKFDEVAL